MVTPDPNPRVAALFQTMAYGPAPESDAAARAWIARHGEEFGLFIGGAWVPSAGSRRFDTVNPATGVPLARVSQSEAADIDAAVRAARAAFPPWAALSGHARARHLYALARAVQRQARLFAVLETLDNGKPIRETRDIDVPLAARHFYHHAGWAQLRDVEFPGYSPLGVVGQIIPWNFPLLMAAWKLAPALAAGNTVVLKPSEFTPLTALLFAEIAVEAGLPPGVLNVVTGDGETGKLLVAHPEVDKIAFTGSTEVGREIRRVTAGTGKRLTLELGGKSPFIVFDDADMDSVVEGVVDAIWFNQGQVCCAGSRLLVAEGSADRLVTKLRARMETLRVGSPLDKAVDLGAIVAPVQLARIRALVEQGVAGGASMWQPSWACPTEGYFYPPTLFTNVAPAAVIAQVEIFGPVLVTLTFRTPGEAVALANNTPYGLAASVWTENINLALDVAPQLKAGVVWINCTNVFDAASGFGGYRESGFGREGGREGMWEYLKPAWETGSATDRGAAPASAGHASPPPPLPPSRLPSLDRTYKLFIGGAQVRPDQGYATPVRAPDGRVLADVALGSRKDIRDAVEAAHAAREWGRGAGGHARAQVLYYVAENLAQRAAEFARTLDALTACGAAQADGEVDAAVSRLFTYAAWADKFDGAVHAVPLRAVTLAMNEPVGVLGIVAPEDAPLLGFVSVVAPALALGNTVVAVPSEGRPLAATELMSVLAASDLPAGVLNIVTGPRDTLARALAEHDDVQGVWYWGSPAGARSIEEAAAANLKRTWVVTRAPNWFDPRAGEGHEFLRRAAEVKNIWVPYGE